MHWYGQRLQKVKKTSEGAQSRRMTAVHISAKWSHKCYSNICVKVKMSYIGITKSLDHSCIQLETCKHAYRHGGSIETQTYIWHIRHTNLPPHHQSIKLLYILGGGLTHGKPSLRSHQFPTVCVCKKGWGWDEGFKLSQDQNKGKTSYDLKEVGGGRQL